MKVVATAGQLNSGKDVLCDYLVEKLNTTFGQEGFPWQREAFANAVKNIFCSSFGVDRQFVEDWKRNPEPPEGYLKNIRQSLQFIGDGFRTIKGNIWIEIALRDKRRKMIISDSRYFNEAKAIQENGGINIILYRPGFLNDDPNPSESQIRQAVEWCLETNQVDGPINRNWTQDMELLGQKYFEPMKYYDLFIVNDGNLEDLYRKVDKIVVPYVMSKFGVSST